MRYLFSKIKFQASLIPFLRNSMLVKFWRQFRAIWKIQATYYIIRIIYWKNWSVSHRKYMRICSILYSKTLLYRLKFSLMIVLKVLLFFRNYQGLLLLRSAIKANKEFLCYKILVIYLCIHGKCNLWDYVTMTRDAQLFKVWRTCFLQLLPKKLQTINHHQMTSNRNQFKFVTLALYQQQLKFLPLLSPTKATGEKGRFLKAKQMKLLSVLLLTKAVKGENKTPKLKTVQTPSN